MLKTTVIVGAGHRGLLYASYALEHPDKLKVVGVVDPNPLRLKQAMDMFGFKEENCFKNLDDFLKKGKIADSIINATMDKLHIETSIPLLEAGYDLLLEKPISTNKDDLLRLKEATEKSGKTVMICHVLRYAPFYVKIRELVEKGEVGDIINIQTSECVSYHHSSASYIRGKWNKKSESGSSMLMAKCCHDLDIISWMKSGVKPVHVSSFGGIMQFKPEKAPKNAGTRCLVDCPIENDCMYSAKKIYIDHPDRWSFYVWSFLEGIENPSIEDKINSLKTDNPHGVCIYKCGNDIVDHQSLIVEFEDGCTATHNMIAGSSRPGRKIHIVGTKGEIEGFMEDGYFVLRKPDVRPGKEFSEEKFIVNVAGDAHGGGDLLLVDDFVKVLCGEKSSISTTHINDSLNGHLIGFTADMAMDTKKALPVI